MYRFAYSIYGEYSFEKKNMKKTCLDLSILDA